MPINRSILKFYPPNWKEISHFVRFVREHGTCQNCGRIHGDVLRQLPDGRWYDNATGYWRHKDGTTAKAPDIFEFSARKETKVFLAAAHMDQDPRILGNEEFDRLAAWCQRCHLNYDRPYHIRKRQLTIKSRWAVADLFLGAYGDVNLLFVAERDSPFAHIIWA